MALVHVRASFTAAFSGQNNPEDCTGNLKSNSCFYEIICQCKVLSVLIFKVFLLALLLFYERYSQLGEDFS